MNPTLGRRLRLGTIAAAVVSTLTAGPRSAVSAQAAQGRAVDDDVTGQWQDGFTASVETADLGEPSSRWGTSNGFLGRRHGGLHGRQDRHDPDRHRLLDDT
ncbi:hypothetical protein [Glycomyces rhizosphaerae]|uniref:Uncharacterized protein n=1 Tax=Glycomyces rhizosphaerae TaxID=2054422 RepID=A0ABV7PZA3_9ACTN